MKRILFILALVWSCSARAATGEVELIGSIVTSTASASANINDGDLTTYWTDPAGSGGWIGYDLGTGTNATITGYAFAPQPSTFSNYGKEEYMQGVQLQSASGPTFTSPTTLDTVPTTPFYYRFRMWERSASASAQCFRLLYPSWSGLAELRLYATASTTARARPMAPIISPWGGRFPTGSRTVTLTSRTTSASIYYTTNGTVPTTSSLLYSGPFTLSFSTNLDFRAIAYDASLSTTTSSVSSNAFFVPWSFKPNEDWRDNSGSLIEAHYGDIYDNTATDGFYYWYGGSLNYIDAGASAVDLPTGAYKGVWMYKGTDLRNWTFVGNILPDLNMIAQRPHFVKNASTGLLTLWAHNTRDSLSCVATSTLPAGPWNWYSTNTLPAGGVKDCNLFKDVDGRAFLIHSDTNQVSTNGQMRITLLASDYLTPSATQAVVRLNSSDEAPVLFRNGSGNYYAIFSYGNYYDNTSSYGERYITSSSILGAWTNQTVNQLWAVDPVNDARYSPASAYNGQPSFVVQYNGKWILGRDQWHNRSTEAGTGLYTSRQVWTPFSFDGAGNIVMPSPVLIPWELTSLSRMIGGKVTMSGKIQ
jgi:hypothetical protein